MKKPLLILASLLAALVAFHVWMFWPVRLEAADIPAALALPAASPPPTMAIFALPTGHTVSRALFAFRGGEASDVREFAMTAYLVKHPKGSLLIDAGMGSNVAIHYAALPALTRAVTSYVTGVPAGKQLEAAGIALDSLAGVVLTHAHWDHVSGMTDMPNVPVWVPEAEAVYIAGEERGAALAHSMTELTIRPYPFNSGPYLGYPASHDVWGDGAIVIVPAPGHTPGSVIVFVTLPDARRFAFVGDLVWQLEGVERPAERPWVARALVDDDATEVKAQLVHLAGLARRFPELIIVPAHDARPTATLPRLKPTN